MNVYEVSLANGYRPLARIYGRDEELFQFTQAVWSCEPITAPLIPFWTYEEGPLPKADFPAQGYGFLAMTQRAFAALRPLLAPWGEFLRAPIENDELVLYHYTERLDALDLERSEYEYEELPPWLEQPTLAKPLKCITRHMFREDVIGERVLFQLANYDNASFGTEALRRVVEATGLVGLDFYRVYPAMTPAEEEEFFRTRYPTKGTTRKRRRKQTD